MKKKLGLFFLILGFQLNSQSSTYDSDIFINEGIEYWQNSQYDSALESFTKVDSLDPEYLRTQYYFISLLQNLKKNDQIDSIYQRFH